MPVVIETEVDYDHEKQINSVLVGIRMDQTSRELLNWVLENVTEPGDCVVAVHVCSCSRRALKSKASLEQYLELHRGLFSTKKVELKAEVLTGNSVQRVLVKEAKNCKAIAVVVGTKNQISFKGKASTAKGCAKQLPLTTDVLAIHRGNIIFRRSNDLQLPLAHKLETSPSSEHSEKSRRRMNELKEEILKMGGERRRISSRLVSVSSVNVLEQTPGWPLLRRSASSAIPQAYHGRKLSVVHWVMNLPERKQQNSIDERSLIENQLKKILSDSSKWCCYDVLKTATSDFSPKNVIGKGGCNKVYKGVLQDGKAVAVKISKSSSKETITDFVHEVGIVSSLNHQRIDPLLGVCVHENDLISVYDLSSKGSLEENLHGKQKGKDVLSWEERFSIAIGLAEALDYLHNQCSKPVIHRDVKSSNVLLSDEFEPQLSDFGLSMWAPTSSQFLIQKDVVGTFGYLAPEYFMYGKVSDKVDVYAFGVVLLELMSGRTSISSQTPKGQESLVMWAKPMMENEDSKGLLDPNLSDKFDEAQFQRLVLAAKLCLIRAASVRPNIKEILGLLRKENEMEKWIKFVKEDSEQYQDFPDDEVYPNSSVELHLSLAMLGVEENSSVSSSSSSYSFGELHFSSNE